MYRSQCVQTFPFGGSSESNLYADDMAEAHYILEKSQTIDRLLGRHRAEKGGWLLFEAFITLSTVATGAEGVSCINGSLLNAGRRIFTASPQTNRDGLTGQTSSAGETCSMCKSQLSGTAPSNSLQCKGG